MKNATNNQIAETILNQIGRATLMEVGARDIYHRDFCLSFTTGKGRIVEIDYVKAFDLYSIQSCAKSASKPLNRLVNHQVGAEQLAMFVERHAKGVR